MRPLASRDVVYDIMCVVTWEVEFTETCLSWLVGLPTGVQDAVSARVRLLENRGPALGFPYSSAVVTSRHKHMRELRVQWRGKPYRLLYAFDPRRVAIVLDGGDKTGDDRFYEVIVPRADRRYERHLRELIQEGLI